MKFIIPLGFKYGRYWHLGNVFGPYEGDEAVKKEIASLWADRTAQFLVLDGQIVSIEPSSKEKPESEKREPGNTENYVRSGDGGWKCKDCGADILGAQVAHPVWIRGLSGGTGEREYETEPYCPNCEKKPNFHGAPVYAN